MATKFAADVPHESVLVLAAKIVIRTPAHHVFDILARTDTWPQWNTFMPSMQVTAAPGSDSSAADGTLKLGAQMNALVRLKGNSMREQALVVTDVHHSGIGGNGELHSISWKAEGFPELALRGLRTSECCAVASGGGNDSEFLSWEWMAGPLAYTVKFMYGGVLQTRFEEMAMDLKNYAEKTWAEQQALSST